MYTRGFFGVGESFVRPELRLDPSPVNTKNSEIRIKTKTFSCVHKISLSEYQIRL